MADLDRWSINESLLQSYRSLFISSQSFLLAVGAIMVGKERLILLSVAFFGLVMIWMMWFPAVRARHRIVDYYKFAASLPPSQRDGLCSEGTYVKNRAARTATNEVFGIRTNWRETRLKLDLLTPLMFTAVWFVLILEG
ncbi:hypothetical protein [Lysobacter sp. A3-1-A15]|uniref:hypothetical protein n=1 Tax=Novilysobacter viscosus TaxID=3098602 RepID=UPI002ED7BA5B